MHADGTTSIIKIESAPEPLTAEDKARQEAKDAKFIAEVAETSESKDALLRRKVRMYTVIERAVCLLHAHTETIIFVLTFPLESRCRCQESGRDRCGREQVIGYTKSQCPLGSMRERRLD